MSDLAYTAMLIGLFAVLMLILRGIELCRKPREGGDEQIPGWYGKYPQD